MANTIKLKRGTSTPTTSNISSGEVAIDTSAQKLYINDSGTVKEIGGGGSVGGSSGIDFNDDVKVRFGTGNDLEIFHDATHTYINNTTGDLRITDTGGGGIIIGTNSLALRNSARDENYLTGNVNGAVELYYDNVKKLETVSNGIKQGDSSWHYWGDSDDLYIGHNGTNSSIVNTTGELIIRDDSRLRIRTDELVINSGDNTESIIYAAKDGAVELYYDNSKKLFTTADGVQIIDDSSYQLELKRDGSAGQQAGIKFIDGGDATGRIIGYSGHIQIGVSPSSNSYEDAIMCNVNGSVELYYDGTKQIHTTSTGVTLGDSKRIDFGDGADLKIYHDGSNSYIQDAGTGQLRFLSNDYVFYNAGGNENIARFTENGAVELYYDNSKKLHTHTAGVTVTGYIQMDGTEGSAAAGNIYIEDNGKAIFGNGSDLQIFHSGVNSVIDNNTGGLYIRNNVAADVGGDIFIQAKSGENSAKFIHDGAVELYYDNSKKLETSSAGVKITGELEFLTASDVNFTGSNYHAVWDASASALELKDNTKLIFGTGDDLQIYHDGTHNYLYADNGELKNRAAIWKVVNEANSEIQIKATENAAVELYYDNVKKFETTSSGATVTGNLITTANLEPANNIHLLDSKQLLAGASNDLQLYHTGADSFLNNDTGQLYIRNNNNVYIQPADGENGVVCHANAQVELYYNNVKTLTTAQNGAVVYGPEDGIAQLELYADEGDDNADKWRILSNTNGNFHLQNHTSGAWENTILATGNGTTELYYDNSKKFETKSDGIAVEGSVDINAGGNLYLEDGGKIRLGNSEDLQIFHDGSSSFIKDVGTGNLELWSNTLVFRNAAGDENLAAFLEDGTAKLYYDNSKKLETFANGIKLYDTDGTLIGEGFDGGFNFTSLVYVNELRLMDSEKILLGDSQDLQIYHDATENIITTNNSAVLQIRCNGTEKGIEVNPNGAVELYYDNTKMLETHASGTLQGDSCWSHYGDDADFYIGHNGYNAFLKNSTGDTNIQADALYLKNKDGDETYIKCANDNQVELYHNNVKRLETKAGGVQMHGDVWAWEIYNNTTSGGANVRVQSSGLLQRDTSSRRYKNSITDAVHGLADLKKLRSVTFKGNNDGDTIFGGLIAEEVHDAGLTEFVDYNDDNQPEALCYGNMVSLCIKAIQELAAEVETLKTKVTALEAA